MNSHGLLTNYENTSDKYNEIEKAEKAEMQQMIDYDVFEPIGPNFEGQAIPSKMFTVEKFSPTGKFVKMKSRLVAGGHREVSLII